MRKYKIFENDDIIVYKRQVGHLEFMPLYFIYDKHTEEYI